MNYSQTFVVIAIATCGVIQKSKAQFQENPPTEKYYTVLGSFAVHDNAKRMVRSLADHNITARYTKDVNDKRGLYYVYTTALDDPQQAQQIVNDFRKNPSFFDAWVRKFRVTSMEADTLFHQKEAQIKVQAQILPDTLLRSYKDDHVNFTNTEVFLSLYNASNNKVMEGKIKMVDPDQVKLISEVNANEYLMLPVPKNKSGTVSLICDVFGYRKIQYEIDFTHPLKDSTGQVELFGTTVVIHFDLVRYRRGDITSLYNVYFYNDAAIMTPESKYQLQQLLALLNEKPNLHIKLHGHSNGNQFGKVIVSTSDTNFFSLSTDSREMVGSSKMLSGKRAEIVKNYLVFNGISADRIEVSGWGGKRPIADALGQKAKRNLRVDVEITKD